MKIMNVEGSFVVCVFFCAFAAVRSHDDPEGYPPRHAHRWLKSAVEARFGESVEP